MYAEQGQQLDQLCLRTASITFIKELIFFQTNHLRYHHLFLPSYPLMFGKGSLLLLHVWIGEVVYTWRSFDISPWIKSADLYTDSECFFEDNNLPIWNEAAILKVWPSVFLWNQSIIAVITPSLTNMGVETFCNTSIRNHTDRHLNAAKGDIP